MARQKIEDNNCVEFKFIDDDCEIVHDIRTGGVDGSANKDGVYGGAEGEDKVNYSAIDYMRTLPCGPVDIKAIRTLFYRIFKKIDEHCQKLKNIACGYDVSTLGQSETLQGVLAKVVDESGDCRTTIIKMPYGIRKISLKQIFSTGEESINSNLPKTLTFNDVLSDVPDDAQGLIVRAYLEVDSDADTPGTVGITLYINGERVGSVETGGQQNPNDAFFAGDFHVPFDGNKLSSFVELNYNDSNDAVYEHRLDLVGYF